MSDTVKWTDEAGHRRETPVWYFFVEAGGPDAGRLWVRSPRDRYGWPMRPAEEAEIKAAEAAVAGLETAREVVRLRDNSD